jgi:hypothetical protein
MRSLSLQPNDLQVLFSILYQMGFKIFVTANLAILATGLRLFAGWV